MRSGGYMGEEEERMGRTEEKRKNEVLFIDPGTNEDFFNIVKAVIIEKLADLTFVEQSGEEREFFVKNGENAGRKEVRGE